MPEVGAFEAKTQLSQLLQRVQAGKRFVITKHNRPVAELVPFQPHDAERGREAIDGLKAFQKTRSLERFAVR